MTTLCRLAEKYGTDKLGVYTPFYDLLLDWRRFGVLKVLEIGIGSPQAMGHVKDYKAGASLRMWREYFPAAVIYGIDINPNAVRDAEDSNIHTFQCDQRNEEDLRALFAGKAFDFIVDDGCHEPGVQIATAEVLLPYVIPGGIYIIEDIDDPPTFSERLPWEHTIIQHVHGEQVGRAAILYV